MVPDQFGQQVALSAVKGLTYSSSLSETEVASAQCPISNTLAPSQGEAAGFDVSESLVSNAVNGSNGSVSFASFVVFFLHCAARVITTVAVMGLC